MCNSFSIPIRFLFIICRRIFCIVKTKAYFKLNVIQYLIQILNIQPHLFSGRKIESVPDILYRSNSNCICTKIMPGSAQNPWATELKTRKKSASRKRSVPGKKGNAIIEKSMSDIELSNLLYV